MQTKKITLLAPARNKEIAIAAIQAGADAVYIGAPQFGARYAASNSLEDIAQVVAYAHPYHVEVLVTLNTLLHDDEFEAAVSMAHDLYSIGVDALIIQDLRLLDYPLPPIRLHASTQCDNRTVQQVQYLESKGFSRVVLARELSLDEIRSIRHQTTIELEAFIHGALCVSYSGRCYISEVLMDRSANRGCCAQYCRMRYDLLDENMEEIKDAEGKPIHQRYLLSLQDMDRSLHLKQLIDAGVTTFKIEGRLKDADYVTNVVAYYRQRLDEILPHPTNTTTHIVHHFQPNPSKTFHRGGINYFLQGREKNMANWETPKSTGERIGEVVRKHGKNSLEIALLDSITLHNGDGLCVADKGFAISGITTIAPSRVIVHSHTPLDGDWCFPIYRNWDINFQKLLKSERRIAVDILFEETPTGYRLRIGEHVKEFEATHQNAQSSERAMQTIKEQLSKLGGTPYVARNIDIRLKQARFIPISQLNQWRRETLEQ